MSLTDDNSSPTSFPLFRHADANVMAQMKAGLENRTIAQLLGPAGQIVFCAATEWGGYQTIANPAPSAKRSSGTLRLSKPETLALQEARLVLFDDRLADAIRSSYGQEHFVAMEGFPRNVQRYRRRAVYLHGASTEQHIFDFVEIFFLQGETVSERPEFLEVMERRGWSMERRCRTLRQRFLRTLEVEHA